MLSTEKVECIVIRGARNSNSSPWLFYRDRNLVPAVDLGTLPFVGYGEEEKGSSQQMERIRSKENGPSKISLLPN
jgi:hypothetical protein